MCRIIKIWFLLSLFLSVSLCFVEAVSPRIRLHIEKPEDLGLELDNLSVTKVEKDSIAAKIGIKPKDTIVACDETTVNNWDDLIGIIQSSPYHSQLVLTVASKGLAGETKRNIKCDLLKGQKLKFARIFEEISIPLDIGLLLKGTELRVDSVVQGSPGGKEIQSGDEIKYCQGKEVKSWEDIIALGEEDQFANKISFKLARKNKSCEITVKLSNLNIPTSGGKGGQSGTIKKDVTIDGIARKYELMVPEAAAQGKPISLVVLLHGTDSSTDYVFFHWQPVVGKKAILAAPWGDRNWNGDKVKNDEKLISQMIDEVKNSYNIDLTRIYVSGHSRGAFYTYYWGTKYGDMFAAAGMFAGGVQGGGSSQRKCPFIIYHGELDSAVPIAQGRAAENTLKGMKHEVKFIEEKGGTPDPQHHEMDRQGIEAIWNFFQEHTLRD